MVSDRYLTTLTTPAVQAAQRQFGSDRAMRRLIAARAGTSRLGEEEAGFIGARDGFYLGTTSENGWPYVQYRGGPPGFLRVLDDHYVERGGHLGGNIDSDIDSNIDSDGHRAAGGAASVLGWADYRGNRQYLSVGNMSASTKVSLFLMDYAHQERLKILGEARWLDVRSPEAAPLLPLLTDPGYRAHVERVVTVRVHGYDWNCPQHITPRWTAAELAPALEPLHDELDRLRTRNHELEQQLAITPAAVTQVS